MKEHLNRHEIIAEITPVIENTAMRYNLIPIEIDLEKESGQWFLRIFVFCTAHPVNIDDCENLSRGLDNMLDELIPFKYRLEISSPGLFRKIKSEKEYLIFKGKKVILKLADAVDEEIEVQIKNKKVKMGGEKKIEARILDYQKGIGLTVLKLNTEKEHIIPLENITSAQLNDDEQEK